MSRNGSDSPAAVAIAPTADRARVRRRATVVIAVVMAASLCFFKVKTYFLEAFKIPSGSMAPTLLVGDHVFARRITTPARGDIVVFGDPQASATKYVKRIVGLGGDVIAFRAGQMFVNDRPVERRRLNEACESENGWSCVLWEESFGGKRWRVTTDSDMGRDFGPALVPPGHVFVIGDNRDKSRDSRVFGPLPATLIEKQATVIWWSTDEQGRLRWDRLGRSVQ